MTLPIGRERNRQGMHPFQKSPTGQSKVGVLRVEHAWFGGEGLYSKSRCSNAPTERPVLS
jgi:hypothetical protein